MNEYRTLPIKRSVVFFLSVYMLAVTWTSLLAQQTKAAEPTGRLLVVWTSGDRDVANNMVFMYVYNAKTSGWWKDIRLLVWGPSSKLLSQDTELQAYMKKMQAAGVEVLACKACADIYGIAPALTALGIDVKYMGGPLTDMIKSGWTVLTF